MTNSTIIAIFSSLVSIFHSDVTFSFMDDDCIVFKTFGYVIMVTMSDNGYIAQVCTTDDDPCFTVGGDTIEDMLLDMEYYFKH